jgi:hypothetical protein
MSRYLYRFCWLFLLLVAPTASAQMPKQPKPPAKYRVDLRYDIPAPRDAHVAQYDAFIDFLEKLGFEFDPPLAQRPEADREDRGKNRMQGWIVPTKARRLLESISVASVMLIPDDFKLA